MKFRLIFHCVCACVLFDIPIYYYIFELAVYFIYIRDLSSWQIFFKNEVTLHVFVIERNQTKKIFYII